MDSWPISLDHKSGMVYLKKRVDRESLKQITVPIMAKDSYQKTAFTRFQLIVDDENDNEPVWIASTHGYEMWLGASTQEGENIAMVSIKNFFFYFF